VMGLSDPQPKVMQARLATDYQPRGNRPTYHPAHLECGEDGVTVHLVAWQGSADLQATIEADAMAVLPADKDRYPTGTAVDVIDWGR